jgi:hypothetical protein
MARSASARTRAERIARPIGTVKAPTAGARRGCGANVVAVTTAVTFGVSTCSGAVIVSPAGYGATGWRPSGAG